MIILVTMAITNNFHRLKCNEHITLPYVVMFTLTAWPLILHRVFWQRFFCPATLLVIPRQLWKKLSLEHWPKKWSYINLIILSKKIQFSITIFLIGSCLTKVILRKDSLVLIHYLQTNGSPSSSVIAARPSYKGMTELSLTVRIMYK